MSTATSEFDQLQAALADGGVAAVLDNLVEQTRARQDYRGLFEARKMQLLHRYGLPPTSMQSSNQLDEERRRKFDDQLIEVCREVGMLLLGNGRIREGWMYMQPVGDKPAVAKALAKIEVDDENLDEMVEITLHEGVDAARGFSLILNHYGTCNAITTFEGAMPHRSRAEQQTAAGLLVEHIHRELLATVKGDVGQQQGTEPREKTLRELVADREWLFGENSYHLDTTHLAATIRFSRLLENKDQIRLAIDLTEYGRRLSAQFQYRSEEPFADLYPSHALYLRALLGENVDEALAYFRQKAESLDPAQHGSVPVEVYVDLLARLGRYSDAIDAAIALIKPEMQALGYAPSLLELAEKAGEYSRLTKYCQQNNDLLGFATSLVCAESRRSPNATKQQP